MSDNPLFKATNANGASLAPRLPLLHQGHDPLASLLLTKLHIPRLRPRLVLRPQLVEKLQQGMERALTLLSAPAGFGKTTLLTQWLAESSVPAAWVSLGSEENDPTRFLSYVIAALQTLDAQLGTTAVALLLTPQPHRRRRYSPC
jgi:LuxR family maltose regulon positive regulatory protein